MAKKLTIEFKDPDFSSDLRSCGVTEEAAEKLRDAARWGEYWTLELEMNPDGSIKEAKFV